MQKPDLDSHSLIRFLDKFVYRNAKASDSSKGVSIMQPLRATKDLGDIWLGSRGPSTATTAVNSTSFKNKKVEDIAAEDVFFHQYFQQAAKEGKETKKKTAAKDGGSDDEDEQEDEIWKALVDSRPEVDDEGSDLGFDDLDEDEMASDGDSPALSLDDLDSDDDDDMSVDIEGSDDEGEEEGTDAILAEDEDGFEVKEKSAKEKKKSRRKQLKELPMFASVDDYAELLAGEEDM